MVETAVFLKHVIRSLKEINVVVTSACYTDGLYFQPTNGSATQSHFVLGDLRKFTEQFGDIIQWDQSNRAYIMTHGVSGIDWKHYKHPLPENVYDVYMQYWNDVEL